MLRLSEAVLLQQFRWEPLEKEGIDAGKFIR